MGLRAALGQASPVLLEPIMKVEVDTPEEHLGYVIGDLNSRRGRILGMEAKGTKQVVLAQVPLAHMIGYATALRSGTQGRASYSMEFECYREVPKHVQDEIVKKK
jgi:elongation factor G